MFHVSTIKRLFKLRVSDYNKIVEYLNNLCGGLGINIKRPDTPSASNPPVVEVDRNDLANIIKELTAPPAPQNTTPLASGFHAGAVSTLDSSSATFNGSSTNGFKVKVCTRVADDGQNYTFIFREFTYSGDGRVVSIGQETYS